MSNPIFPGRHYETGTIVNTLLAAGINDPHTGKPVPEADVLGASGGIAFGYFVFEYGGYLPHVALLTRNTFDPFNRALDGLGIRRETRETTNEKKAEENLRRELDMGNPVLVWADLFSLPFLQAKRDDMWIMAPVLVVGYVDGCFQVVHETEHPFPMTAEELSAARGRVKKDRYRSMVIEGMALDPANLHREVRNAVALFLDKPPAGSANNFGAAGLRFWAKMLVDAKNAKGWPRKFEPGPKLVQALAGTFGQPGVWDWIETWGTQAGADRATYADFLSRLDPQYAEAATQFRNSAGLWYQLAEATLPDSIPEFQELKRLKRKHQELWRTQARDSESERSEIRCQLKALEAELSGSPLLADAAPEIQAEMSAVILQIAEVEQSAFSKLRSVKP